MIKNLPLRHKLPGTRDPHRGSNAPGPWTETMAGGSPQAERLEFDRLARDIMLVQLKNQKTAGAHGVPHPVDRTVHAKPTLASAQAELAFLDLPGDLRAGFAQPGHTYPAVVRFSNASGTGQPDTKADLRGMALRVQVSPEESHDLLATNFPVSHARNARQFVEFLKATTGSPVSKAQGMLRLIWLYGLRETIRMLKNVLTGRSRTVSSVATETYWSRGAYRWGPALAVRFLLRPAPDTVPAPAPPKDDPNYLSTEAARRLAQGDIRFELCLQRFVSEEAARVTAPGLAGRLRRIGKERVFVLHWRGPGHAAEDSIYLSQRDVRELQFAKAAIATGWQILLEEAGLTAADVKQVLLAGSFGSYLSPASAIRIGLVPEVPVPRVVPAGNVAGEGAKMALLSLRERAGGLALLEEVRYVELSDRADFNDRFVEQLSFPGGCQGGPGGWSPPGG